MRQVLAFMGMFMLNTILFGQNNDCNLAVVLCDNINLASNPVGPGFNDFLTDENNSGCINGNEHESEWYYFQIADNAPADQEITFIISPNAGIGEDYDFAVYGPNSDCNSLGSPIRCSYAATGCANCPNTGLDTDATDNSEGAAGDGIVAPLIVQPGEGYYILIDNFLSTGQGFQMQWGGAASTWLDCAATPPCATEAFAGLNMNECQGVGTIFLEGTNPGQNFNTIFNWSSVGMGNDFISDTDAQNTTLDIPSDFSGTLNYIFTVQEGSCIDTSQIQINIAPTPEIILPFSTSFCLNEPAFTFPISPEGGTWSNLPNGIVDPMVLGVGDHEVIYSYNDNISGCSITENILVTILDVPSPTLSSIPISCVGGDPIQLTATPSGGNWSSNVINGIFDPSNPNLVIGQNTIEYSVIDPNSGCLAIATQIVEVQEEMDITIDGNPVFCINESTTLSIDPNFETYLWSDNSINSSITLSSSGLYTVTVTNASGCVATNEVNVIEDGNFPIADAGIDLTLDCAFNSILIGGNSSQGDMNYNWTSADSNIIINQNNNINASINQAGYYQLMVTNNYNGCTAIDEVTIFENTNLPTGASFDFTPLICFGDMDATLSISNVQNGTPPYSYAINQSAFQDNNTFSFLGAETYSVIVQDANFCQLETEYTIPSPPEFLLNLGNDITISLGDETELRVLPNYNILDFVWQADSTLPCIDCFDPIVAPLNQTTYFASATSEEGCFTEEFITVFVEKERNVFIPNAFSPNEDGINDIFKIYGGTDVLKVNSFRIFNRWGDMLYEAIDFEPADDSIGWDGFLKGKKLPNSVYIYIAEIEFIDGWKEIYKGDLTLMK